MTARRNAKRLVIDTDVASSASPTSNPDNLRAERCLRFLEKVLELELGIVISAQLVEEWKRHQSRYFGTWLRKMFARKLHHKIANIELPALRERIEKHGSSEKGTEAMLKDVHLLEAAIATDKIIASMNESDRKRFKDICEHIAEIREIMWVNPDIPDEKCLEWLDDGAPSDDFRKLGYVEADEA